MPVVTLKYEVSIIFSGCVRSSALKSMLTSPLIGTFLLCIAMAPHCSRWKILVAPYDELFQVYAQLFSGRDLLLADEEGLL
jgi:hypothetical protein